ncbi:MAG: hypothetical protein C0507_24255 [Cyanobacteria bacterium PR.3.49]|nr:hypothetical protein [Cyanobacteria bacterium PR.3.49]
MKELGDVYDYLLNANASAVAAVDYDSGYHFLAAALHLAQTMGDADRLLDISKRAGRQQVEIDTLNPAYHHSSHSAKAPNNTRNNKGIFENLSRQALIASSMVSAKKKYRHH